MLAVITGASGLLGANLAIELLGQGHTVRATRRGASRVSHLQQYDIAWADADLGDVPALARAFQGADVVFHCAAEVTICRTATLALVRANVDGTRHVLKAVREAGVRRLVHCSTVGAVGLSEDGRPCTEESRWNFREHGMDDGYNTTKREAEELVRAEVAQGLDAVIVNPTYMFGPYDARPSSGRFLVDVVRGKVPGWTPGYNNFVDVRDVARGMILAAERGKCGERYILGGDNLTYKDIMERIARVAGVAPPARAVPRWMAKLVGMAGDLSQTVTGQNALINSVTVGYSYCTTYQFSPAKAERELGFTHGPIETAIADAITWFRANGML